MFDKFLKKILGKTNGSGIRMGGNAAGVDPSECLCP